MRSNYANIFSYDVIKCKDWRTKDISRYYCNRMGVITNLLFLTILANANIANPCSQLLDCSQCVKITHCGWGVSKDFYMGVCASKNDRKKFITMYRNLNGCKQFQKDAGNSIYLLEIFYFTNKFQIDKFENRFGGSKTTSAPHLTTPSTILVGKMK